MPEARAAADLLIPLAGEGAEIARQVEREIGGVPSVVYTPHGDGPFPVLVFIHGGGWVINGPQHYHPVCQDLAAGAGCVVVSIDYRMAPEHKAPVAATTRSPRWVGARPRRRDRWRSDPGRGRR